MRFGLLAAMVIAMVFHGCASGWQQALKNENDLAKDQNFCKEESEKLYPPLFLYTPFQAGPLYPALSQYNDSSYRLFKGRRVESQPKDYYKEARKKEFTRCMNRLGWEWTFQAD